MSPKFSAIINGKFPLCKLKWGNNSTIPLKEHYGHDNAKNPLQKMRGYYMIASAGQPLMIKRGT